MKLFVGLSFQPKQQENLVKMQTNFLPLLQKGKQVKTENLHCTLLYLGEIDKKNLTKIKQQLYIMTQKSKPFYTAFSATALFSNGCLVTKLKAAKELLNLHTQLVASLSQFMQTEPSPRITPHATLFREAKTTMPFTEAKKFVDVLNMPFLVESITLFCSTTTPGGVKYDNLANYTLA